MSERNNSGPAFPTRIHPQVGLTKRDYFAAHAPAEVFNMELTVDECGKLLDLATGVYNGRIHYQQVIAKLAYRYADAMIAEREQ